MINYEDKLINFNKNIEEYDEIIIDLPIWNGRLSSPINTVLKTIELKDKNIKFILYNGSGKATKASKTINEKYPVAKKINLCESRKNVDEV